MSLTDLSPAQQTLSAAIRERFVEGVDFRSLGGRVMWIRAADGTLRRRFIAGSTRLSQHAGGNAEDIAPVPGVIDGVERVDGIVAWLRGQTSLPVGRILWRGVAGHFPHHAHIEGEPPLTQSQLWDEYDKQGDDDVTVDDLVEEIQGCLVAAGYDLGAFGPNGDGVDRRWGSRTRQAFTAMAISAREGAPLPDDVVQALTDLRDHQHRITVTLQ